MQASTSADGGAASRQMIKQAPVEKTRQGRFNLMRQAVKISW
jgi:hypothetical protein